MTRHRHRKNHKPQQAMTRNEKLATRDKLARTTGQVPDCYRVIVELSCMINNDDAFYYSKVPVTHADMTTGFEFSHNIIDRPRLVLCRPVYHQEIDAGLDISKKGPMYGNAFPDITRLLDAYFRLKRRVDFFFRELPEASGKPTTITPSQFLSEHIGSSYYDCMSGGMPLWEGYICYYLCQHPAIDLDELVYPGKDRSKITDTPNKESWYTLRDWLTTMHNVPDIKSVLGDLKLPSMFEIKRLPERTSP